MVRFGELSKETVRDLQPPEHQEDATLDQDDPVSGTKYTLLATTTNVRIIGGAVKVTWTVQPSPLEVHITIDGVLYTFTKEDPVTATFYMVRRFDASLAETAQLLEETLTLAHAFLLVGRTVKVEVETTGGTVSNISARVKYAKW